MTDETPPATTDLNATAVEAVAETLTDLTHMVRNLEAFHGEILVTYHEGRQRRRAIVRVTKSPNAEAVIATAGQEHTR